MYGKLYNTLRNFMRRHPSVEFLFRIGEGTFFVRNCRDYTSSGLVRNVLKIIATPFRAVHWLLKSNISSEKREGLAIVLIAKNEAPYIEEWINFHLKQGVSHFLIYDNESTDNLHTVLAPYIERGLVTYSMIKGRLRQIDAYSKAISDYGHKFKYMAIIDADEFMFVRKNTHRGGGGLISISSLTAS